MRPPGMGNPFGFGSFNPTPGAKKSTRFPRLDAEVPPPRDKVHHRTSSTILSDTDSDREKELEHMRIRMASL